MNVHQGPPLIGASGKSVALQLFRFQLKTTYISGVFASANCCTLALPSTWNNNIPSDHVM